METLDDELKKELIKFSENVSNNEITIQQNKLFIVNLNINNPNKCQVYQNYLKIKYNINAIYEFIDPEYIITNDELQNMMYTDIKQQTLHTDNYWLTKYNNLFQNDEKKYGNIINNYKIFLNNNYEDNVVNKIVFILCIIKYAMDDTNNDFLSKINDQNIHCDNNSSIININRDNNSNSDDINTKKVDNNSINDNNSNNDDINAKKKVDNNIEEKTEKLKKEAKKKNRQKKSIRKTSRKTKSNIKFQQYKKL